MNQLAQQQIAGTPPHSLMVEPQTLMGNPPTALSRVGDDLHPMSDAEREAAAYRAGVAMHAWYSQFQLTGNTKYLDIAHDCMGMQRALLAGRSPRSE
jgi:hypothetical protein